MPRYKAKSWFGDFVPPPNRNFRLRQSLKLSFPITYAAWLKACFERSRKPMP